MLRDELSLNSGLVTHPSPVIIHMRTSVDSQTYSASFRMGQDYLIKVTPGKKMFMNYGLERVQIDKETVVYDSGCTQSCLNSLIFKQCISILFHLIRE